MTSRICDLIEKETNDQVIKTSLVGGGCISNSERLLMKSGRIFFLKSGRSGNLFFCEANGLEELRKAQKIRVPSVILADKDFILLENISIGVHGNFFFRIFGQQLAQLHQLSFNYFGFYEDNFVGSSPQKNIPEERESKNWTDFYLNKRLLFQLYLAEKNGYATDKLRKGFHLLENKIGDILSGSEENPSLVHGDLWSGNFLSDQYGNPVLIDPAVYYGHREADLAMTKLFGGFPQTFYEAYEKEYPLKDGFLYRQNLYMLYHVLNHLNLFGRVYYLQAEKLLWDYL